jgi:hypothetical protein
MNRKDAEKMADDIFDMIDRNHPRGLIKSELVDLLAKWEQPETPTPKESEWVALGDILREQAFLESQKMRDFIAKDICGND